jgi:hypothetical protein
MMTRRNLLLGASALGGVAPHGVLRVDPAAVRLSARLGEPTARSGGAPLAAGRPRIRLAQCLTQPVVAAPTSVTDRAPGSDGTDPRC